MRYFLIFFALTFALVLVASPAHAHPIPDIPVRTYFEPGGTCRITVEVDTRCFTEDPLNEPYLLKWVLEEMGADEREELKSQATQLLREAVSFNFAPSGPIEPEFDLAFTTQEGKALANIDDPVMLTGTWVTTLPEKVTGYQVAALKSGRFDIQFLNWLGGQKAERMQVLFPDEESFVLDISSFAPPAAMTPVGGAPGSRYLPLVFITVAVAGAVIGLQWSRRNRGV